MGFPDQPRSQGQPRWPGATGDYPPEPSSAQSPGYSQVPGPAGGYQPGYQSQAGRTNGMAIAALVCGIAQFLLWFFLLVPGFIAALLALIFGVAGFGQIKRRGEGGRGMAIAGIALGALGVLGGVVWIILFSVGTSHFHYHGGY